MNSRFFYFTLPGIIAIAFILYLGAASYGLPQAFFGDELVSVAAGFSLLAQKTLRANFDFYYLPPLLSYLLAPAYVLIGVVGIVLGFFESIGDYQNFVLLNRELFLIVGRIISALFGIGGVYLLFAFARRVFSPSVALLSAIFLAFDFLYLHEAQVGRFWAPATFFIIAAIYSFQRLMETRERKWYFLSALAIGLGYGVGYIPLILVFWLAALQWHINRKGLIQKKFIYSSAALLAIVAFFSWANPVAFFRQFGRSLATLADLFGYKLSLAAEGLSSASSFFYNIPRSFLFLWYDNPALLAVGVIGLVFLCFREGNKFWKFLLIGFPLLYLLIVAITFSELENRYLLPIVPFLSIGAAAVVVALWESALSKILKRAICAIILFLLLGYELFAGINYFFLLRKNDTRNDAVEWIYRNAPDGSVIILDLPNTVMNNNRAGILYQQEKNPFWINTRDSYLLTLPDDRFPKPNYFVLDQAHLPDKAIDFSRFTSGYYLFSFWSREDRSRALAMPFKKELAASFYPAETIFTIHNLLQDPSSPFSLLGNIRQLGPYIEVYKFGK